MNQRESKSYVIGAIVIISAIIALAFVTINQWSKESLTPITRGTSSHGLLFVPQNKNLSFFLDTVKRDTNEIVVILEVKNKTNSVQKLVYKDQYITDGEGNKFPEQSNSRDNEATLLSGESNTVKLSFNVPESLKHPKLVLR